MNEVLVLFLVSVVVGVLVWVVRWRTKPRVRVIPMASTAMGSGVFRKSAEASEMGSTPCILVVNEGETDVEVVDVGYVTRYGGDESTPRTRDGGPVQRKLAPDQSFTVYFAEDELENVPRYAMVELADGKVIRGTSRALKQLRERMEHRRLARMSTRRVKVA